MYWALFEGEIPVLVTQNQFFKRARHGEPNGYLKRSEGLGFSVTTVLRREDERHLTGGVQRQFITEVLRGKFPVSAFDRDMVGSTKRAGTLSVALRQHERLSNIVIYLEQRRKRTERLDTHR